MKIIIYLFAVVLVMGSCKSKQKMAETPVLTQVTESVTVQAPPQEAAPAPVKEEKVILTHGTDIMRYCIIVGSFINEQNAVNLRRDLIAGGFKNCSIMLNPEKMYRVSAVCFDNEAQAQAELSRIRSQARFADAWLLKVKE